MERKKSTDKGRTKAARMLHKAKGAMAEMQAELAEAKMILKHLVEARGGDPANKQDVKDAKEEFQQSLKVVILDDDSAKSKELMSRMYGLYEKVFPIAEEREELDKLLSVMGKNHDKALQASGAPFREQWILVIDEDTSEVVAARNTITFSAAKDAEVAKQVDGTQHLIYGFVDPRYRSFGLGDFTMGIAEEEARKFVASTFAGRKPGSVDLIQISEQNAPLKMSMESMLTDTAGAKTDQFWRREYYESLGFRELDFDYVQLPLEPRADGGEPSRELNLITRGVPAPDGGRGIDTILKSVPADSVRFHLYNFFDRSVAAGQYEVETDIDWIAQSAALKGTLNVKPKLDFNAVKDKVWTFMENYMTSPAFTKTGFADTQVGEIMSISAIPEQAAGLKAANDVAAKAKKAFAKPANG